MMTGHDFNADSMKPHIGSVVSRVFGAKGDLPANVVLPGPIGNTGAGPLHGQTAAHLGSAHEPFFLNTDPAKPNFKVGDLEVPRASRRPGWTPASGCSNRSMSCRSTRKRGPSASTPPRTSGPSGY